MENQTYHIQMLLVDKLDNYKGKGNKYTEGQIKEIQDVYKQDDQELKKPISDQQKTSTRERNLSLQTI